MGTICEKITDNIHDLNNKLSCILGITLLAKRTRCQKCQIAEQIHNVGLAMGDILSSCREEFSKDCKEEYAKLDIYELFHAGVQEATQIGKEMLLDVVVINRLSLGCSILALPTICDSSKQIINNLFFNAKKANATQIKIVGVEHQDYVAVHIIDDGDGMSAETVACLGLSVASKTSTGMGTRIVKKLATQEGVAIEWSSPGIGAGCCVTVRMTKYKDVI